MAKVNRLDLDAMMSNREKRVVHINGVEYFPRQMSAKEVALLGRLGIALQTGEASPGTFDEVMGLFYRAFGGQMKKSEYEKLMDELTFEEVMSVLAFVASGERPEDVSGEAQAATEE